MMATTHQIQRAINEIEKNKFELKHDKINANYYSKHMSTKKRMKRYQQNTRIWKKV